MTAIRRTSVLGLAVLLAAATADADTVITAEEVIPCSVASASADSVRLKLTQGGITVLSTRDVYEIRLADSNRVAELANQLLQLRITLDSSQYVRPPAARAREMIQIRLDQAREARANGLPWHADVIDTLARGASPGEMAERCLDMGSALLECRLNNEAVTILIREVIHEQDALRGIWSQTATHLVYGAGGGLPGMYIGAGIGSLIQPAGEYSYFGAGCPGAILGCAAGSAIGVAIGTRVRAGIVAVHRGRVNDLVRRVNRAVASTP